MTRIPLLGALLVASLAVHAQTAPATPAVPSPLPPAASSPGNNPFAPRVSAPVTATSALPQVAPAPAQMTEESVKANVESSFRAQGDRVGRVNGQTFFKISADNKSTYLFIPTGLQDAQPVVPNARSVTNAPPNNAVPPHVPMPAPAPAAAPAAAPTTTPQQN
jgi:hypothetical protein